MSTRVRPRHARPEGTCVYCGAITGKDAEVIRDGYGSLCRHWDCSKCGWSNKEYPMRLARK